MQIYNTLTRKKEEFKPIKKGKVGIYACGPTVYNYAHIGNLRAMIFYDIIRKYFKFKGYDVKFVMNITDVDDKIIRDSTAAGKSLKEFTRYYEEEFFKDIAAINIMKPDIAPRATEHVDDMVDIIKKLKENGHTYEKDGSIYFKISTFKDYGKLAKLDIEGLKENAEGRLHDSDEYEKDDARDFALWKEWKKEDGKVFWETDIGKGRPGWHIECSAMSTKHLGDTFDIHLGGVDLIFPHHTNEIAQTEGATGKKWVNYWMHNEHLLVDGTKMSKSKGNFYTLKDLFEKGYKPKAIRWLFMSNHYRQQLNFTIDSLKAAEAAIDRLEEFMRKIKDWDKKGEPNPIVAELIKTVKTDFETAMDDDFETSRAFGVVFDLVKEINKLMLEDKLNKDDAKKVYDTMMKLDIVLGVLEIKEETTPKDIQDLVDKRDEARNNKDWDASDKLRDELKEKGWDVKDTSSGTTINKI